jgi:hypothetical protein
LSLLAGESRARHREGDRPVERPVELGPCNAQECVVASGLREGDLLVAELPPS